MARSLDFSPIDYRQSLLSNPTGNIWGQTIRGVAEDVSGAIQQQRATRQKREAEFVDKMKYDTAITANNVVNGRIAQEYNDIKNKWVDEFDKKKGRLTPADKINMQSDLQALDKLARSFKTAVNSYEQAKKIALTDKGKTYNLDNQKWADLMSIASGDSSPEDLIGFMTQLSQSNTETPFLNYKEIDPSLLEGQAIKDFKTRTAEPGTKYSTTKIVNGREVKTETQETAYGSPEDLTEEMIASVSQKGGPGASLYIQNQLTDEEKQEAVNLYGDQTPFINYYYRNKKQGEISQGLQPKKKSALTTKPEKKGGGGLMINFGGSKTAPKGSLTPQDDVVEGVPVKGYIEVAKARPNIKLVKGVTVKGAQLLSGGETSESEDRTTPGDYEVLGVSVDNDEILLRQKVVTKSGTTIYDTFKAPREGNEHFLSGLFSEETINEMEKRGAEGKQSKEADPLGIL